MDARDQGGGTALHGCVWFKRAEVANAIIGSGRADLNARDNRGYTALHFCVDKRDTKMAETLLAAGCDVDARNAQGFQQLTQKLHPTVTQLPTP